MPIIDLIPGTHALPPVSGMTNFDHLVKPTDREPSGDEKFRVPE